MAMKLWDKLTPLSPQRWEHFPSEVVCVQTPEQLVQIERFIFREGIQKVFIDTETTGLDPLDGHRVAEIGAVGAAIPCRHPNLSRVFYSNLSYEAKSLRSVNLL